MFQIGFTIAKLIFPKISDSLDLNVAAVEEPEYIASLAADFAIPIKIVPRKYKAPAYR